MVAVRMTREREALTLIERVAILKEALRLIRKPENWTKGEWKCPLYTDGYIVLPRKQVDYFSLDRNGGKFSPYVEKGQQQYAYCVEGAINQATINVLGMERARMMGVGRVSNPDGAIPTELVSVNGVLREAPLAADDVFGETRIFEGVPIHSSDRPAQALNDSPDSTHEVIVKLLRKRLRQLRAQIKKES